MPLTTILFICFAFLVLSATYIIIRSRRPKKQPTPPTISRKYTPGMFTDPNKGRRRRVLTHNNRKCTRGRTVTRQLIFAPPTDDSIHRMGPVAYGSRIPIKVIYHCK